MPLSKEINQRITMIEKAVYALDNVIAGALAARDEILRSDEQYAGYLDHYRSFYDDNLPLSIRNWYLYSEELDNLNAESGKLDTPGAFDSWFTKNGERVQYLERRLGA